MRITIHYEISDRQFVDTLTGACEGGSNYWIHSASRRPYTLDGKLVLPVTLKTQEEYDGADIVSHKLTRKALERGIGIMAHKYPKLFAEEFPEDPDDYNGDANSADVFLQLCLFGEVVYG